MNPSISKKIAWLGAFIVFLVAVSVFQDNRLRTVEKGFFVTFDRFSQALVVGNIVAHDAGIADKVWNLGFVTVNGDGELSDNIWNTYKTFVQNNEKVSVTQSIYASQYGIQGVGFLKLHNMLGINSLKGLQIFNSLAMAFVVTALAFLFTRAYDWRLGVIFFLVMLSSPWVVSFARNLYWVPFTWFLPAVFATMAYLAKNRGERALCLLGVGAAVFLKSLAGYEYLSNITLFSCSVFVIAPFFRTKAPHHWFNFKLGCIAFIICLVGFAAALLVHAGMRGDTIVQGLSNILEQDVKRRTYGDPSQFDPVLRASLTASIGGVISMYWTQWSTPVVFGIPAKMLNVAVGFVLVGLFYCLIKRKNAGLKVLVVLVVYFLASISWFVAAKAHSFAHTQLNYVLWYFGFIQALAYGVWTMVLVMGRDVMAWRKTPNGKYDLLLISGASTTVFLLFCLADYLRTDDVDQRIDQRLADSIASVEVENGFKVLFFKDKQAVLLKTPCSDFDSKQTVMLHVQPDTPNATVANMDFAWQKYEIKPTWFSKYRDTCMTEVPLPQFRIKWFNIGQYETNKRQLHVVWQGRVELGNAYFDAVQAMDHSDANWERGISRVSPAILLPNNFANRQSLKVGDMLKLDAFQQRTISQIAYTGDSINVHLEGPLLSSEQSGFPHKFEIIQK